MKSRTFRKKSDRIKDFSIRRGNRFSFLGKEMEKTVEKILRKKIEEGVLHSFQYNAPNSPEDRERKDFTVRMMVNGEISVRHFGITISKLYHRKKELLHCNVPCILITFEMREERTWERIEELFKN
ncbi:MAG: hypothetical protein A3J63_03420 [Candidatus Moranbacteria bacterium RIFCSPHIGHO2_02_FULL_40_12b]|nr:MAG: hypothetical protein A3J63_03420 [Candidatus Moranbacteria bacterium RIFCSPHIGHO2_02_FULL_40_12b]OGI23683.1 MAG: hypothetical protein A3E91_04070 [Candidatus Moranbacteria bacterium RIFCSPHIGHO2_12_FULL_40_10]